MKKANQAIPNQWLINERLRHHWTQKEVAERIGTSAMNYSRWERGTTSPGTYFRSQLYQLFEKHPQELGLSVEEAETARAVFEEMLPIIPPEAQELIALAQYGLARVDAAQGNIHEAYQRGETSLGLFQAMGHRNTQDVQRFLNELHIQAEHLL